MQWAQVRCQWRLASTAASSHHLIMFLLFFAPVLGPECAEMRGADSREAAVASRKSSDVKSASV